MSLSLPFETHTTPYALVEVAEALGHVLLVLAAHPRLVALVVADALEAGDAAL